MKPPRDRFIAFVHAREEMRKHKEKFGGPGPHSDDPVLANYTFCNINREDDYVTKFIHEHFRVPFSDKGRTFMVRQMLFCRIFNEPAVLELVCPLTADTETAIALLEEYKAAGNKVMRGAYLMPPHGAGSAAKGIVRHWLSDVVDGATKGKHNDYTYKTNLAQVAEMLMRVTGVGPFIANQVCTDLRYVPVWGPSYTDWMTFILCGPGTRRGMNRFMGRDLSALGSDAKFTAELLQIRDSLSGELSANIQGYYVDPNNLSNSFCEFDKYERAQEQLAAGEELCGLTLRHYIYNPLNH